MARIHYVKKAQQRYVMVPVLDAEGNAVKTPVIGRNGEQKQSKRGPVFRRPTVADKSQPKPMPTCGKCGKTIEVGQPYRWVKVKSGPYGGMTKYRCGDCPTWKQSELSMSKMAGIYAAQEDLEEAGQPESVDELQELAQNFAEAIRSVAEEYRESQQNMEDGFGHATYNSDELGEKADALEGWADEVEQLDFDDFDEDDHEQDEDESDEDHAERVETERESHWSEQYDRLIEAAGECPV